jgi:hypothetical protein
MTMLPVSTGDSGWGSGGAAALGAFVGSWFGNGWGGTGRGGVGGGMYPDVSNGVALGANVAATALISDLATLQDSVNSNALASANGFAGVNQTITSGLSSTYNGLNNTLVQGMLSDQAQTASIQSALCQGFGGLNTAIVSTGNDNRFAMQAGLNSIQTQMSQCCCETQKSIAAEGAATRQLIQQNLITDLQTQLCDSKARIAQQESQIYLAGSQAAQTQQIIQSVLAHLPLKV